MIGSLASPLRGLVTVLSGNQSGLVRALNAIREQKEAAGPAPKGKVYQYTCQLQKSSSQSIKSPFSNSRTSSSNSKRSTAFPPLLRSPMMAAGGGAAAAPAAEKTEFDAVLTEVGAEKIKVIKAVRELTSLGSPKPKRSSRALPKPSRTGVTKDEAESIKKKLEEVGAKVEIK